MPSDAETYYQLGRMINMQPEATLGGKGDEAAAAWRHALKAKPDMVEAHQMLALRLVRGGKAQRQAARKHAQKALHLAPDQAMSYVSLGMTYSQSSSGKADGSFMKPAIRTKAIDALKVALQLDRQEAEASGGQPALSSARRAETHHAIGQLLASRPTPSGKDVAEAREHFRAAMRSAPKSERYQEASATLEQGVEEYVRQSRAREAKEAAERAEAYRKAQHELEAAEEAEAEQDEDGFVDIR